MAPESAITAKGQATIPKAVRDHLGVKPGDRIKFFIQPDGRVFILPKRPVTDLKGFLKYSGPTVTIEEMSDAIKAAVAEADQRSKSR